MGSKSADRPVAAIYAQALYEAAQESGALAQVSSELDALRGVMLQAPRLELFLQTPTVAFADKRKLIESAFSAFSLITQNFLLVLVGHQRAHLFESAAQAYTRYSNEKAGIASVEVQSARELEEDERARLIGMLEQKLKLHISLVERVRPELLGGLVLRHEDRLWDRSLSHALFGMHEKMAEMKLVSLKWKENGSDL